MKKQIFTSIVALALLCACGNDKQSKEQQSLMEASKQELAEALSERDQLLSLVGEVSSGMEQIKHIENILTLSKSGENKSQRAQLLADMETIQKTLKERREQLERLEAKLKESALFNKELQTTIEALRAQIDSQAAEIEDLRTQLTAAKERIGQLNHSVDSLNTTVANVTTEKEAAQKASLQLENELNTCYYAVGSKSNLKKHKVIETGFLRKSKLMKSDFDPNVFVISDKRTLGTISLRSKKAKMLTNHPAGSYELVDNNGQKVLRITKPQQFWELSNYLVVQTD
ncbi:MAG: hypothetical protein NC344_04505 [Bacteroidales bacterium]|nr:hypothetical protein [Bacteroidales bacterium]MCM1147087.1 hypothetical protein [Bacteroidales bacterium]MCM1205779.1 hypothetical protein [Bacillota bacterium]MCM1511172.1 hypothetical protein [Clostridium sp.]